MKNRERLRNMALFDLLCMIHNRGDECVLVLVGLENKDLPCIRSDQSMDCKTCLNNWLNKEEEHGKNT